MPNVFLKSADLLRILAAGVGEDKELKRIMAARKPQANGGANLGFEQKMNRLTGKLEEQFAKSAKLEKAIRKNLAGLDLGHERP